MADSFGQKFIDTWNSQDPKAISDLFAEDGTQEDLGVGDFYKGHESISAYVVEMGSDYHLTLLSEQVSAHAYAIEWEVEGRHTSSIGGTLPPTNKPFRFRAVSVGRLDGDGKIVENRDYYNMAAVMAQLGLLPV